MYSFQSHGFGMYHFIIPHHGAADIYIPSRYGCSNLLRAEIDYNFPSAIVELKQKNMLK